jgi:S-adenosylmethionine hydrolase
MQASRARIALLTDFGVGPYTGQMQLRLTTLAPEVPSVLLISDLPAFRPDLAAYLLPGLARGMPSPTVYACVVDPGVGTARDLLLMRCERDWWLAPDNGLLIPVLRRCPRSQLYRLRWRPPRLSASFHGRDLFVPVAAKLAATGERPDSEPIDDVSRLAGSDWPSTSAVVCYVDAFGNLITGLDADDLGADAEVGVGGRWLRRARTFAEVRPGEAFWYRNAFDLVEIAVNLGRADEALGRGLGSPVAVRDPGWAGSPSTSTPFAGPDRP